MPITIVYVLGAAGPPPGAPRMAGPPMMGMPGAMGGGMGGPPARPMMPSKYSS